MTRQTGIIPPLEAVTDMEQDEAGAWWWVLQCGHKDRAGRHRMDGIRYRPCQKCAIDRVTQRGKESTQ